MFSARILSTLGILAFASLLLAQAHPHRLHHHIRAGRSRSRTMTVYRNGSMALIELNHPAKPDGTPANRSLTLYDLKAMASFSRTRGLRPPRAVPPPSRVTGAIPSP